MKTISRYIPGYYRFLASIVTVAFTSSALILGGCASESKSLLSDMPVQYDALIIKSVSLKGAELEDDNSDNIEAYNGVRAQLIREFSSNVEEYVRSRNLFKTVLISDNADDVQKYERVLVLQTRFDKIVLGDRGKRVARYLFVGIPLFGRGIMMIEAKGRLVDGKSNKVLVIEKYDDNTSWDASSLEDNLLKLTRNIAHDYAQMIEEKITSGEPMAFIDAGSWE